MKLRPIHRPTEVKAVATLLEEASEVTPEELAEQILLTVDGMRTDRTMYAVAVQGLPCAYLYHSFPTAKEAEKWVQHSGLDFVNLSVGIVPMFSLNRPLARHLKEQEALDESRKPGHPTVGRRRK